MKKYSIIALIVLLPLTTFASFQPVSWLGNFSSQILQPLQSFWAAVVKGDHFVATSTTVASTFPYASTTAISASGLTSGRVPFLGTGGLFKDSANLTWDNSTNILSTSEVSADNISGVGTAFLANGAIGFNSFALSDFLGGYVAIGTNSVASQRLSVNLDPNTGDAFRLIYNNTGSPTVYMDTTIGSDSKVSFTGVGSSPAFTFNGKIGISSTSPGTSLSVGNTGNDTINISPTATSTFGSGLNLRTGCFAIAGTCLSGSAGPPGPAGSGLGWASTTAPDTKSIYSLQSSNVGISSSSPFARLSVTGVGTGTGINFQTTDSTGKNLFSVLDNGQVFMSSSTLSLVSWLYPNGTGLGNAKAGLDWLWSGSVGSRLRADNASGSVLGDLVYYDTTSGSEVERFRVSRAGNVTVSASFITQNIQHGLTTGSVAAIDVYQKYPGGTKAEVGSFKTFSGTGNDQYKRLLFFSSTNTGGGRTAGDPGIADIIATNADFMVREGRLGVGTSTLGAALSLSNLGTSVATPLILGSMSQTSGATTTIFNLDGAGNLTLASTTAISAFMGKVGIGTTTPITSLSVNGDITIEKGASAYTGMLTCYLNGGTLGHISVANVLLGSTACTAN